MLSQEWKSAHAVLCAALASLALVACQHARPDGHMGWTEDERTLESSCQAGAVAACRDLGERLTHEKRPNKDLERGLVLLDVACGESDWKACGILGGTYADFGGRDEQAGNLGRAVDLLGRACAHRIAAACTRQGDAIARNTPQDRAAVKVAFLAGCELGDALGCESFAVAELRSPHRDVVQAERGLARACQLARLESCHGLATLLSRDPQRRDEAARLWQRTCDQGLARSCDRLLAFGAPLLSLHPDCRRVGELAGKRCLAGDRNGCAIRSACQLRGGAGGGAAILEALAAACAAGNPLSCLYWADASERGKDPDAARIQDAYARACHADDLGRERACVRELARDLKDPGSREKADQAALVLSRYCSSGDAESCCELGNAYQTGKNLAKDPQRAERLRGRACDLGLFACCSLPSEPAPETRE
jgi:TPR repeat protein